MSNEESKIRHSTGDIPTARPVAEGIPQARPIIRPDAPPIAIPADEMLLPASSALAALADIGILACALILFQLAVSLAMGLAVGVNSAIIEPETELIEAEINRAFLLPSLVLIAIGSMGIIAIILRCRRQSGRSVGISKTHLALNGLIGVGAAILVPVLFTVVAGLLRLLRMDVADQMEENAKRIMDTLPKLAPLGLVLLSAMVGLYEEVVFRGFLMTRLRRATGSWIPAVLISTAIFVALHSPDQTPIALVAITILSLVFSLVAIWRRSLVPVIVAHTLFDLFQFLYLYSVFGESWT